MTDEELISRTVELARESVREGWGGPFGALVVHDGEVIATGQNVVLRSGDPTAHAEVVAIRNAAAHRWPSTLDPLTGDPDGRARMLSGCTLYTSSFPCPMCYSAIAWARIDAVVYACDVADAAAVGFDDEFLYQDLARPVAGRRLPIRQVGRDVARRAFAEWLEQPNRRLY